jgi:serine/threonine-protein kinase RIO1
MQECGVYEDKYAAVVDFDRLQHSAHRETRHTGRDDRATSEQVLDPRTRLLLFKMMSSGVLKELHGCVSTGKEVRARVVLR